jgi:hypothetical protein
VDAQPTPRGGRGENVCDAAQDRLARRRVKPDFASASMLASRSCKRWIGRTPGRPTSNPQPMENTVLETLIVILIVLWLLGMVSSYTLGGFIHILLVVAVVILLLRVIRGRQVI